VVIGAVSGRALAAPRWVLAAVTELVVVPDAPLLSNTVSRTVYVPAEA
jgi:hypothetical protein